MVRPATSIGQKWNDAFVSSADDAIDAYGNALPNVAQGIIDGKAAAKAAYVKALDSASFDANVRAGLAPGVADVAYRQRLEQIQVTGFTDSIKSKMVSETQVRRHLGTLIPQIIGLANGQAGNLKLPDVTDTLKAQIINVAMMSLIRNFSTTSTAASVVAILKTNVADLNNISVG